MRRLVRPVCFCALAIAFGAMPASATPVLTLQVGSTVVTVADGSKWDWNNDTGAVTYVGSVGNFYVNVSTGTTKPAIGSASDPELELASIDVASGQGTLIVTFTEDGFTPLGPAPTVYQGSIAGTSSSGTVTYETSLNQTALGSGTYGPGDFTGVFESTPIATSSPYSLTQVVTINLTGLLSSAFFTAELRAVPEPASLVLFGTGLVALATLARKARRKRAH